MVEGDRDRNRTSNRVATPDDIAKDREEDALSQGLSSSIDLTHCRVVTGDHMSSSGRKEAQLQDHHQIRNERMCTVYLWSSASI